ncbi:hypothetical protein A3K93_03470 [Acinetobacter sp. NCu2D-2]|uniref:hypothetical protein n=1 Tax=Acinetobacter sp. NCu2D-2 TaxID=1608473 RepID=UPI0007CDF167|nr:hypothetical protein [Acinetobacter sp. NCu2D-2]ANF83084.1 hypothetical protein A3K93_03470 [Acinetobacter sp. NCu2D-2]
MPSFLLYVLLRLIRFSKFKGRSLTSGEVQLCRQVFGDLIRYSDVYVMNHPYLPWQARDVIMAPSGFIHARAFHFKADYSKESLSYQALFIHEMAHILQYQKNINVLLKGALLQSAYFLSFKRYNPYAYTLEANKSYWDYNIEQQGDIARDIFLKKIPNIILNDSAHSM